MRVLSSLALVVVVAGCTPPQPGQEFNDPYEARNRKVHAFNTSVDRAVLRPAGQVASAVPMEITQPVSNFADNTGLPGMVVNGLLQADIGGAATNTMRFLINTTVGIGGLFDPAGAIGLHEESTDFGETLAVWGVQEGAYMELPFVGPSTERDTVGMVVDLFIDPLSKYGTSEQQAYVLGTKVVGIATDRGRFGDTVDSILYESADSYAQTRLYYLQNRRFELGLPAPDTGCGDETGAIDPYIDPYDDVEPATCEEAGVFIDPYEDF